MKKRDLLDYLEADLLMLSGAIIANDPKDELLLRVKIMREQIEKSKSLSR